MNIDYVGCVDNMIAMPVRGRTPDCTFACRGHLTHYGHRGTCVHTFVQVRTNHEHNRTLDILPSLYVGLSSCHVCPSGIAFYCGDTGTRKKSPTINSSSMHRKVSKTKGGVVDESHIMEGCVLYTKQFVLSLLTPSTPIVRPDSHIA